jgi:hypothetical protein
VVSVLKSCVWFLLWGGCCTFDWAGSDPWQAIERNLYFSSSDKSENDRVLLKRKRKWFKANIDPNFEWSEEPQQTYGNKSQPAAAAESPKSSPPGGSSFRNANPSPSPSSAAASASTSRSKYGAYVAYVQLALHFTILLNVLTYILPIAGVDQQSPSFYRVMFLNLIAQGIYLWRQHGVSTHKE